MRKRLLIASLLFAAACVRQQRGRATVASLPAVAIDPPRAIATITGVKGPESCLYDPEQDVYFISNINGGELAKDGNGFITRVDAKTMQVNLKWIEGGRNGVHLDGPKGMTIVGNALWVSDVTAVRAFDRHTGAPIQDVPIPGATFINDLTTDGTNVYMSDTGLRMGPALTFIPTGTEAIWRISGRRAEKIASGSQLEHPNGIDWVGGRLRVASFGGDHLYDLHDGKVANVVDVPDGELDGLVHLPDGEVLVSSWLGDAIYRGKPDGPFQPILESIDAPADIGYDPVHHRLLVPHSASNEVTIHPLGP